jgi:hypothetical protein
MNGEKTVHLLIASYTAATQEKLEFSYCIDWMVPESTGLKVAMLEFEPWAPSIYYFNKTSHSWRS